MNPHHQRNQYCVPIPRLRQNGRMAEMATYILFTVHTHTLTTTTTTTHFNLLLQIGIPHTTWRICLRQWILRQIRSKISPSVPVKKYMSTNTICKHNIPDILFLRSFNLNSTYSARGNVSYLFFFLRDKHTTFYGRLHVLYVSTI